MFDLVSVAYLRDRLDLNQCVVLLGAGQLAHDEEAADAREGHDDRDDDEHFHQCECRTAPACGEIALNHGFTSFLKRPVRRRACPGRLFSLRNISLVQSLISIPPPQLRDDESCTYDLTILLILNTGRSSPRITIRMITAITSSITGSSKRIISSSCRLVRRSSASAVSRSTFSSWLDSSPTDIISTISRGKYLQPASGSASLLPAVTCSAASAMALLKTRLPAESLAILSD